MKKSIPKTFAVFLMLLCLAACGKRQTDITTGTATPAFAATAKTEANHTKYTRKTKISEVINNPVFDSWGRLIFPVNSSYRGGDTLENLSLTWYSGINPDKTVEICNYFKDRAESGEQIFYDIYTDEEKAKDSAKENTGLFFSGEIKTRRRLFVMQAAVLLM